MSSAAAMAGGLIGSSLIGLAGGERANSAAADRQKTQMSTEIELANTAHQREVSDLKEAGLNPILSASGSGSSVPSVSPAPVINSLGEAMKAAITNYSAFQGAALQRQQIDASVASANLDKALTTKAAADTTSALSQAQNIQADIALKAATLPTKELRGSVAKSLIPLASSASDEIADKLQDIISNINVSSGRDVLATASKGLDWLFRKPSWKRDDYLEPPPLSNEELSRAINYGRENMVDRNIFSSNR